MRCLHPVHGESHYQNVGRTSTRGPVTPIGRRWLEVFNLPQRRSGCRRQRVPRAGYSQIAAQEKATAAEELG
jgi:hypothetical protein